MTLYNVVIPTKKMCGCKNTLAYYAGECLGKKYSTIPEICNKKLTLIVTFSYYKFKLRSSFKIVFATTNTLAYCTKALVQKFFLVKYIRKYYQNVLIKSWDHLYVVFIMSWFYGQLR
jgi:hypothetical protein